MKKGDRYRFKNGFLACTILSVTKTKVKFRISLANFDSESTIKEFLKYFQEYYD